MYYKRRLRVKEYLYLTDIDAFVTNYRPNFMYLSGFSGSTAFLLITRDDDYLFVDGRYSLRARSEADDEIVIVDCLDKTSISKKLVEKTKELKIEKIGVEKNNLKVGDYLYLNENFKTLVFNYLVENLRAQKDYEEIEKIKKALNIAEKVLKEVEEKLYGGVDKITEIEVASYIKNRVVELGAQGLAFEPIVAFGKNTAFPHYSSSNVVLKEGDFIIVDMGAVVDGYHSDITRSFCVGKNEQFNRLYNIVLEAQQKAISSIKADDFSDSPYKMAVEVFEKYGLADKFVHGLGHGVGLEIHELPSMSSVRSGFLKVGNIVTVEPGIYIEGVGGIRIEDMVLVKDSGIEVLTSYPK
ncbi:MAG: M24 family metallopeptidase [bacterium]